MWFFVRLSGCISSYQSTLLTCLTQLFYRAKQDGAALLGLKHPWDH